MFETIAPMVAGTRHEWDFGDGVTSNRRMVEHTFTDAGEFEVILKVVSPEGGSSQDSTTVSIPFFTFENRLVSALVGLLSVLLLVGMVMTFRMGTYVHKSRKEDNDDDSGSSLKIRKG